MVCQQVVSAFKRESRLYRVYGDKIIISNWVITVGLIGKKIFREILEGGEELDYVDIILKTDA